MTADELVPQPTSGRRFAVTDRVRLADVSMTGRLRLDAIARMLQDVSGADTADAGYAPDAVWVVRRLVIDFPTAHLPRLYDDVRLVTWCSGTGARWAERRTDIELAGAVAVRSAALWVFVDRATGRPLPLSERFDAVYGEAAGGRRVGQRLRHEAPPDGAARTPWPLRVIDLDVLGHVNNAVYWAPVEEALATIAPARRAVRAELEFRGGLDPGEAVEMIAVSEPAGLRVWLMVGADVRASAVLELGPTGDPGAGARARA